MEGEQRLQNDHTCHQALRSLPQRSSSSWSSSTVSTTSPPQAPKHLAVQHTARWLSSFHGENADAPSGVLSGEKMDFMQLFWSHYGPVTTTFFKKNCRFVEVGFKYTDSITRFLMYVMHQSMSMVVSASNPPALPLSLNQATSASNHRSLRGTA